MKMQIADRRRALWCVALRPYVVVSTLALVAACDRVTLPSQLVARRAPVSDTLEVLRVDTVSVQVDTAVAVPVVDSSEAEPGVSVMNARIAELPREEVD